MPAHTLWGRVFLFLCLLGMMSHGAGRSAAQPLYEAPVDPALEQQLADAGLARVVILLRAPAAERGIWAQSLQIAQTQQTVLATVSGEEFVPLHQYQLTPGIVGLVTPKGLEQLRQLPDVRLLSLDMPVYATTIESAAVIHADRVWADFGLTGRGVNVAVIDSGVDAAHPDLGDHIVAQHCFTQGGCAPNNTNEGGSAQDVHGHGTHIAGIITGKGSVSPKGIAPDTGIVAVRVLDNNGAGWTSDVVAAIDWVVANQWQHNVRIINLSLGGGQYTGDCSAADANTVLLTEAVAAARGAGVVVFAAAGNSGYTDALTSPACIPGVIAVGSTYDADLGARTWGACADANTTADQITCFSNSGALLDLLAPGAWIESAALGGGQRGDAGTSMAVAHATGTAALLLQANRALTPDQVESTLKESGVPLTDSRNGWRIPRINALAAVSRVSTAPAPTPTPLPPTPTPAPAPAVSIISGTVKLQGRTDNSGTTISLGEAPCTRVNQGENVKLNIAQMAPLTARTDASGYFELTLPVDHGFHCLYVDHAMYLRGQGTLSADNGKALTLLAGDLTGDGIINIFDLTRVAATYGSQNVETDLNQDGVINIFDLTLITGNYGRQSPVMDWH